MPVSDDDLILHWAVRPYYEPLDDEQFEAAARKVAQDERLGAFTFWPSPLYAGRVTLSGSRDRWVIGCGIGGYLTFQRGTYRSAQEAEIALRNLLETRQRTVAELIARRCDPYPVRCIFPAPSIEVIGDTQVVCHDLTNRRERRRRQFLSSANSPFSRRLGDARR